MNPLRILAPSCWSLDWWLLAALVVVTTTSPGAAQTPPGDSPSSTASSKSDSASSRPVRQRSLFDGKTLKGWRVVDQFDFARHGKVTVEDGAIVMAPGQAGTGIAWKGPFPRDRYEVSLEAMRTEGNDFFCGITFPVGKQYCTLILGGWGGSVVGLSNIDGQAADENETTQAETFQKDRWYHVRLRVTPQAIEVWLDKESIIRVDRKDREFSIWWEQEPMRPFGIASWYTGAKLRKVTLKEWKQ